MKPVQPLQPITLELAQAALAGSGEAAEQCRGHLLRMARATVRRYQWDRFLSEEDVEDIASEAFIRLWQGLQEGKFAHSEPFRGWLCKVVFTRAEHAARAARRGPDSWEMETEEGTLSREELIEKVLLPGGQEPETGSPEDGFLQEETQREIRRAFALLDPACQTAIRGREAGEDKAAIAQAAGCKESYVDHLVGQCRDKFYRNLLGFYVQGGDNEFRRAVEAALGQLSPDLSEVFGRYWAGESVKRTAESLGLARAETVARLQKAKAQVWILLRESAGRRLSLNGSAGCL
jgi:RNA polymerase sigma factor (sigma-70 family)